MSVDDPIMSPSLCSALDASIDVGNLMRACPAISPFESKETTTVGLIVDAGAVVADDVLLIVDGAKVVGVDGEKKEARSSALTSHGSPNTQIAFGHSSHSVLGVRILSEIVSGLVNVYPSRIM